MEYSATDPGSAHLVAAGTAGTAGAGKDGRAGAAVGVVLREALREEPCGSSQKQMQR